MFRNWTAIAALATLSLWLVSTPAGAEEPVPIKKTKAGALIEEKGDVNGDGKPDVWNYYVEKSNASGSGVNRFLVKKEADLDFNGTKDIVRMYDEEGLITQERADLDFDGVIDQENIYRGGVILEKHFFKNNSKDVFIWKFYKDGKLVRLRRDDNSDGRVDYCELWFAGEKLNKRGWDKDGDGECDYWEAAD